MSPARITLTIAVVLCGLSAGFFFTYEASITLGLADVDDVTYVAAFQALNDNVRNPAFALVFFGSLAAIAAALFANWNDGTARRSLIAVALTLYLVLIVVTATGNVALNDDLAGYSDLTPPVAAEARGEFENDWNRLNLMRTIVVVASFALLAVAATIARPSGARSVA